MELKNYFAQDSQGNALPVATCYLYQPGTEVLAEGLVNVNNEPLSNPFASGESGLIQFAAPNGRYDLRVVQGGRDYRVRVQCNDVNDAIDEVAGIKAEIRNRYYGPLAEDPVTRPDGTEMEEGDEYHNTVDHSRRVFVQGVWAMFLGASTADLANAADPLKGAGMLGFDGGTVRDVLLTVKPLARYAQLRTYTGEATIIRLTDPDVAGEFIVDLADTASPDNGITIIVDGAGRRFKRRYSGPVNVKWAGAKGDGVADDAAAIQTAVDYVYGTGGGLVFVPAGVYSISVQITVKAKVTLVGAGRGATTLVLSAYDQVVVVESYGALSDVTCDGNNLHTTSVVKLAGITVRSYAVVENIETKNNYTGIAIGNYPPSLGPKGSILRKIHTHDNESRGLQFDPFAEYNIADGVYSHDNGNAGIILGHGSHENIVSNFLIERINNGSLWINQGGYRNKIKTGIIRNPLGGDVAINIALGSNQNTLSDIEIFNHPRAIQIIGGAVDGVYPEVMNSDSWGNVAENIYAVGTSNTNADNYAVRFQDSDGLYTARECTIRNSYFENFYGVFHNVSDAANNCAMQNIRTKDVGAGGVMKGMKSNGLDTIRICNVEGFTSRARWLSDTFSIDSTGTKTIVIYHGLPYTPNITMLWASLCRESVVSDFRVDHVLVVAVTSSAVTVRVQVGQASSTVGATARIVLKFDAEAENGFLVSALT